MNKIEAFFCIVTPMFLGGADGQTELRMHSVKGLLRFWWRTFVYPSVNGDLKKLAEKEAQLFGSNENCASFQLHFSSNVNPLIKTSKGEIFQKMVNPDRPGARYLGFGLMDAFDGKKTTAGRLSKGCINHNQEFSISAIARNEFSNDLIRTFKLFGLTPEDFTFPGMTGKPCYLNKEARVRFIGNLESKLNAAITHPVSEEQLDYRRCIEHQVQELAGVIRGRRERYRPMVLR
jgi:CRISPR type III-B/RAMP module RAMP protein Cmr1